MLLSAGGLRVSRPEPFDDAPLRSLEVLDLEADRRYVVERLAGQVVGLEANKQGIEESLHRSDGGRRASHVLDVDEFPAWAQYPERLRRGAAVVGDRAEGECDQDG